MKIILIGIMLISFNSYGALTAASCKAKVKAAIQAETGKPVQEGSFNVLLALCEGIIEEIKQNAVVVPNTFSVTISGPGTYPVQNTGKVE